jgi:hypothetical protein
MSFFFVIVVTIEDMIGIIAKKALIALYSAVDSAVIFIFYS